MVETRAFYRASKYNPHTVQLQHVHCVTYNTLTLPTTKINAYHVNNYNMLCRMSTVLHVPCRE